MGSRTPEGHQQRPNPSVDTGTKPAAIVAKPNNGTGPDDDLGGVSDDDDADDDEDHTASVNFTAVEADKKKKRKKSKKKKSKKNSSALPNGGAFKQTSPPRVLLSNIFPDGVYTEGEHQPYDHTMVRTTGEELRHLKHIMDEEFLRDYRLAAETHRQVRSWAQSFAKPGAKLSELAEGIEDGVRALTGHLGLEAGDSMKAGMGFPTGLCVNHVAAHWTPNPGGKDVVLTDKDVLSVDFGVHVNGRIVDSAFTLAWDPLYDPLLEAVKDATNTGIKHAGIDARMSDIGAAIQEAMESYEVILHDSKTRSVKAVRNITGHDIQRYRIHGDKQVPFIRNSSSQRMEEGEVFAIETFGTTGRGRMDDDVGIYGYGLSYFYDKSMSSRVHMSSAKSLLKTIEQQFGTIVFCRRYLERLGVERYLAGMNHLISTGVVDSYGPLIDVKGSYVAQFEHTILLKSTGKEVISRGEDY